MQEITLSQYSAEIERLLQDEAYDEAIAHCMHILKRYPKYQRAYRLLGQAHLENGQDDAALDLFARALSADPEDFLPRIGLSVIYERRGKIAEAAWQMERAYELLPYNEFVREELAKLYARRDGAPLEFLPLTRGALARLYARGHLYAAAIAELESLLQEAPQRADLRVLYLEVLWRDGRRLDAARVAQSLLSDLPYCLKANLILGEFWAASGREAEARELFRRAAAVDPELTLVPDLLGPTASIQPAEVRIERLIYVPPIPAYARPPMEEGEIPEWLQALGLPLGEAVPTAPAVEEAPAALEALEPAPPSMPEAVFPEPVAESPDWLQSVEVASAEPEGGPPGPLEEAPPPQLELPEWLQEELPLPSETPTWMEGPGEGEAGLSWMESFFPPEMPAPVSEAPSEEVPSEIPWQASGEPPPALGEPGEGPAEMLGETAALEIAGLPPPPESLNPEEALAWLARIAEGKEEMLRAQAQREAEARLAEILGRGRRPPEVVPPTPAPPVEIPQAPAGEATVEAAPEAAPAEEAALPDWLLALKPPEEEIAPALEEEERRFRELLEEAAAQPLEIPPEWQAEIGIFAEALPEGSPPEAAPLEAAPAEKVEALPLEVAFPFPVPEIAPEIASGALPGGPQAEERLPAPEAIGTALIWDLLAVDEGLPPAGRIPEPVPAVDPRWLEGLHAVPVAETLAGPLLGILVDYEARLKAQPRDHETRLAMARLLFNLGDTARAVREYQPLMRVAAMRERVIADLEQAVQLRPNESRLWQALGDAYQEAGKLQKALEAYRQALARLGS
jgi:tetratricopeptide (TPR) repeat protein